MRRIALNFPELFFEVRSVFSEGHARPPRGFEAAFKSFSSIDSETCVQGNEECLIVPTPPRFHASFPCSDVKGLKKRSQGSPSRCSYVAHQRQRGTGCSIQQGDIVDSILPQGSHAVEDIGKISAISSSSERQVSSRPPLPTRTSPREWVIFLFHSSCSSSGCSRQCSSTILSCAHFLHSLASEFWVVRVEGRSITRGHIGIIYLVISTATGIEVGGGSSNCGGAAKKGKNKKTASQRRTCLDCGSPFATS